MNQSVSRGISCVVAGVLAATSLVAVAFVGRSTKSEAATAVPRFDHVVVVMFENHASTQITASTAPYFTSLANQGANLTKSFALTHPSEPNYLALFSGSTQGITNDSCPNTFSTGNLGEQLLNAGFTFKAYSEGLPSVGSTTCSSGNYRRRHAPWVNFSNLSQSLHRPMSDFPSDFTALPTVSFVVPDMCNDMHNCSVATGDSWLKSHLDAYAQWAKKHNSLLITTFDEDNSTSVNQIHASLVGAGVKVGFSSTTTVNHYNVLATLEDMYGLSRLGKADGKAAITDVWGASVTVTTPSDQSTTVGKSASLQINASSSTSGATRTFSATGLPSGLSIKSATGLISGTPTATGTSTVKVSAKDSAGASGSTTFTWTVNPRPTGPVSEGLHTVLVGGKALEDPDSSTTKGRQMVIRAPTGKSNQQWRFTLQADGIYTLKNRASGFCLDVSGGSLEAGAKILQWTCTGGSDQKWKASRRLDGTYVLTSVKSGMALTTPSITDGARLTQQQNLGSTYQRWKVS